MCYCIFKIHRRVLVDMWVHIFKDTRVYIFEDECVYEDEQLCVCVCWNIFERLTFCLCILFCDVPVVQTVRPQYSRASGVRLDTNAWQCSTNAQV